MKKIEKFQITGMTISGFKSYAEPTELAFGPVTAVTGGNGRGKSSIADAIAFAITGLPFFGERGIDKLHSEDNPDVSISLRFLDENGEAHELTRTRKKNRMTINYDGYEIRQLDLTDMFGERDVFLSIFNPLYFIEELGDEGKNLLEMHLPMIPHETVLAQLSEAVRDNLKNHQFPSPETFLKKKREDIKELEETIIYLNGQKDQADAQGRVHGRTAEETAQELEALKAELAALEEKRLEGKDIAAMQERMVELSARYEEQIRDSRAASEGILEKIHNLREKVAQRQGEQYQSQYTTPLADANAKIRELAARYKRESAAYKAFQPGTVCPTCHRPATADEVLTVRQAILHSTMAIQEEGTSVKGQIEELQNLDQKARDIFEQFKAEDLKKWEAEIAELEKERQAEPDVSQQLDALRSEIQNLSSDLEYGNLSQEEYDRMGACREEIKACEARQSALQSVAEQKPDDFDKKIEAVQDKITELKKLIADVAIYVSKRAELTFSQLKMNRVEISLYDVVKTTGEVKDAFKFTYCGRRYDRLSLSEKIRAGMELSELMKRLTGRNYPVFVDNMESVDDLNNVRPTGQLVMAKCVRGAPLSVQPMGKAEEAAAQPKAA